MPGSTSKGTPYAVGTDAAASLDTIIQSLAQWVSDRPGVASLTTAEIAALAGSDLWTGRVVFNNQTLKLFVYTESAWAAISINTDVVQRDGSLAFTAAQSHPTAPSSGSHIANKTYVDSLDAENIKRSGSVAFTAAQSHPTAPSSGSHIANKTYVDGQLASAVPQSVFKEVKLRRVASQSILGDGSDVAISWDTEDADSSGFISTPSTTLTVPAGAEGLYAIGMLTTWPASRTDRSTLRVNGADISPSNSDYPPNGNSNPSRNGWISYLQAGDTIQLLQAQISGSALNITASLSMVRLSD